MASQVTVLGPSARRHVVKTMPATYLSDVLEQACTKMHLDPSVYGLKHNNKTVDLSRTMRLSGLTSGAKLELTLLSRSPAIVSVALQLPSGSRMLDKFPSNTTLWLILRKFESGVAGGSTAKDNLTARGIPTTGGPSGAGRLYHEQPVLQIMGRDYANFTDLQKSLAQIGFNNGSVLLKLSFQASETPLEEAMQQIEAYFKSVESEPASAAGMKSPELAKSPAAAASAEEPAADDPPSMPDPEIPASAPPEENESAVTTIGDRPTSIYRPPTSSTPQAAQTPHNPADYVPTVEHARVHQAGLVKAGQNTRLPTDAELAAVAAERAARRASISSVTIKVRFPDESSVVAPFSPTDTAEGLYSYVEGLLRSGTKEPFKIAFAGSKGRVVPLVRDHQKLIGQVGMEGKVLVQVRWKEGASAEARKGTSLRAELATLGKDMEVTAIPDAKDDQDVKSPSKGNTLASRNESKEKGKGTPKWFKMGKK